jgi:tRNA (guanine-N7-)-methyltransferase
MKDKLRKFAEYKLLPNCFEFPFQLKSNWKSTVFKNNNPLVLELGCGKGEYTVALSGAFPEKNFIGIDVKSNRMWKGAKIAQELARTNVAFCRLIIEKIEEVFDANEVDEIWITFPDPFPKDRHEKYRLTGIQFLKRYQQVLKPGGIIHFKTDDDQLFEYTVALLSELQIPLLFIERNVYHSNTVDAYVKDIRTHYEKLFAAQGRTIKYLSFQFPEQYKFNTD